jgi:hypothetical protein
VGATQLKVAAPGKAKDDAATGDEGAHSEANTATARTSWMQLRLKMGEEGKRERETGPLSNVEPPIPDQS